MSGDPAHGGSPQRARLRILTDAFLLPHSTSLTASPADMYRGQMMTMDVKAAGQAATARISTAHLPKKDRFAFWQDFSRSAPIGLEVSAPAPIEFEVNAQGTEVGDLRVMRIRSSASRIERRPETSQDGADHAVINFVRAGSLFAEQHGRSTLIRAGEAAFCVADRPYSLQFAEPLDVVVFKIPRILFPGQLKLEKVTAMNLVTAGQAGAFLHNYAIGFGEHAHAFDPLVGARLSRNIMDLLEMTLAVMSGDEINQRRLQGQATLLRIKALIDDQLANPDLSAGFVAERIGLSARYMNKLFLGESSSLGRFILRRRLENAARELSNPRLAAESIGSIAERSGFRDISHFSNSFRALYGMSPTAYRDRR